MYGQILADEVTNASTTRAYKPGELVVTNDSTYGTRTWRYCKNASGAAWALGTIVERSAATVDDMSGTVCVTAKTQMRKLLGVAQGAVAASSFCFILKEGIGYVLGDGSVSAGTAIESEGTTGRAKTATVTNLDEVISVFGWALEADGAADSTFRAHIAIA